MDIDYNKEYEKLLKELKYKIDNISLPETTKRQFLTYIKVIEGCNKTDELSYQIAITNLLYIQKELEKYMYKILFDIHNLIEDMKKEDNHEIEKDEKITEIKLNILKNNMTNSLTKLKTINKRIKNIKTKIIAYISVLTLLLTLINYTLVKLKNNSKEIKYQTYKETYSTVDSSINYKHEYLPYQEDDYLTIRKCEPWVIEGNECLRKVVTYNISGLVFENIINNNIENILTHFEGTTTHEYKYEKELTKKDKYDGRIYEVIRTTQNKEKSIEVSKDFVEIFPLIISLLSELMLYMIILDINDGSLIASILFEIDKLIQNKYSSKDEIKLLREYVKQFENIVKDNNPSQKVLKKVNKIN